MPGDSYPKLKVAAVQAEPAYLDREACVEKACSLIEEAGRNGAKVIALPEAFIPGHTEWLYFYPGGEAMKHFYRDFFKNSVEVPSPATDRLAQAARRAGAYVAIGISERVAGQMGSLYNSILFLEPDSSILGVHRQLLLQIGHHERSLPNRPGFGHRRTHRIERNDGCALFKSPKHGPSEKFSCRHTFSSGSI